MYGDMGEDTFFADILCNNQLYIVLGVGGTTYGLFLTSFLFCLILICWEKQTLNISYNKQLKSKTYNNQLHNHLDDSKQYKLKIL